MVNKEAAFLVSLATVSVSQIPRYMIAMILSSLRTVVQEHFIKRLTDQSYVQARLDQRKTVALKDLSQSTCLRTIRTMFTINTSLLEASVIKSSEEFSFLEGQYSLVKITVRLHPTPTAESSLSK
jgi:hypothetical protein